MRPAHPVEQDCCCLPFRKLGTLHTLVAFSVFSTSGFHRFLATKPVRSETNKAAARLSGANHGSISGLVVHSFFGLSEAD